MRRSEVQMLVKQDDRATWECDEDGFVEEYPEPLPRHTIDDDEHMSAL